MVKWFKGRSSRKLQDEFPQLGKTTLLARDTLRINDKRIP